jgi:hypothetical protein
MNEFFSHTRKLEIAVASFQFLLLWNFQLPKELEASKLRTASGVEQQKFPGLNSNWKLQGFTC